MPFYKVIIHGVGSIEGKRLGVFTTRRAFAASIKAAEQKTLEIVRADWTAGPTSILSGGTAPESMEVDQAWQVGLIGYFRGPNRGHTFYTDD